MWIIKKLIVILLGVYIGLTGLLYLFQDKIIFQPSKDYSKMITGLDYYEITFKTSDGENLHGFFLNNKSKKTVLFFHGNAGNISHRIHRLELIDKLGYNGLIFDYRGYGKSSGSIKNKNDIYLDSDAALKYLTDTRGLSYNDIIIWGVSIGGHPAIYTSSKGKFNGTIIESTFDSIENLAKDSFPFLPVKLILKYNYSNLQYKDSIQNKLLYIHSKDDETIQYKYGLNLFENIQNSNKKLFEINGSHNGGYYQNYEKIYNAINHFSN